MLPELSRIHLSRRVLSWLEKPGECRRRQLSQAQLLTLEILVSSKAQTVSTASAFSESPFEPNWGEDDF
ncbi:hypothetical protein [Chroococcus sp. FPU101]|uniref:hypothetical protein n=1 Tax=Chroococcus sp. FPU101 TaxID=1974212 RepID=UPI001A8C6BCB|nr:hypothetical protein [Chroococcus sp. FPU101]GFE71984.1 hypothetical protein CFPU101_45940 [Chroococcus sp. FPU101]